MQLKTTFTSEKKWMGICGLKILHFHQKISVLTLGGPSLTGETAFTPESVAKFLKSTNQLWSLRKSCKTLEQQQGYYCCCTV
jgi:hypothetical protein